MKRKWMLGSMMLALSTVALAHTVEVHVDGLNCALCSEKMKTELKTAAHADKVVPRLECGRIYFDVAANTQLDVPDLRTKLLQSGFIMGSVTDLTTPVDVAGAAKC